MTKLTGIIKKQDNITLIKTNKFKSVNVSLKFAYPYDKKNKACSLVLASLFFEKSKNYPTKEMLQRQRDMLYGIDVGAIPGIVGNLLNLTITYNFVNAKFLKGVSDEDYISFIDETLNNALIDEEGFKEAIKNLNDSISRLLDIPRNLANEEFFKELSKADIRFEIYTHDYREELKKITIEDIKEFYSFLFKQRTDIYVVGDYSDQLINYLSKYKLNNDLHAKPEPSHVGDISELDSTKDAGQSVLMMAYQTPFVRGDKMYYAYNLANIMFGGIPASLLFASVREKNSLCYAIQATSYRNEGMMIVKTLINRKNKEKALNAIRDEFNKLSNLEFDASLLEMAKIILITNSKSIDDDLDYLIDYYYTGEILNTFIPMNEYIKHVEDVTLNDIKEVLKSYKESFVYFLEGTNNEENL